MKPFAWFTPRVSDTEYAPKFQALLHMIEPYWRVVRDVPKSDDTDDWEPIMAWYVQRVVDYLAEFTQAHNALVDVKPRRQLMGVHRTLIKVAKAYGYALFDRAQADQAIVNLAPDRKSHHLKHGAQWAALTRRYSKDLVRDLNKLAVAAPDTYELIVGDDQMPEGLGDCADDDVGLGIEWE